MKRLCGFLRLFLMLALVVIPLFVAGSTPAQATASPQNSPGKNCDSVADTACNVCINDKTHYNQFQSPDLGQKMISQMFTIINTMLAKIESTFYNGIISNDGFQQIITVAFILYITLYGVMIIFNLASYRSGEVANRLIKVAIVYCMCTSTGWTFFSAWIQTPVIGGINQLISDIASATSGSGGACVSSGAFSGAPVQMSGAATAATVTVSLSMGPMAMLYGPMTCIFAAKFMAGIEALTLTGFYGWLLALMLLWGLVEFTFMVLGAIATYVKAIVGLAFLFGLAPIFFAFYLFEKSRALTEGWLNMVVGFALQPVMLFAFLAFYASIVGTAVSNMFTDVSGNQENMCYVPFYTMPGQFSMYWWRFTNAKNAAGGQWLVSSAGGSGSKLGNIMPSPAKVLSVLYFLVLCNLGKNFTRYINDLSMMIAGGRGGGAVTGEEVGSWLKTNLTGGRGVGEMATDGLKKATGFIMGGSKDRASLMRPPVGAGRAMDEAPDVDISGVD